MIVHATHRKHSAVNHSATPALMLEEFVHHLKRIEKIAKVPLSSRAAERLQEFNAERFLPNTNRFPFLENSEQ